MFGRSRGCNSNDRFHNANSRSKRSNEYNDRTSSNSQGGGGYSVRHGFNKKVTFEANYRGRNHFCKSLKSKTDLVRDQMYSEFPNQNGPPRNNTGQRSFPERNLSHHSGDNSNFRILSETLKESSTGWYSVFVPNVEDFDEVLKIIQTDITPVVFYPYNKQNCYNGLIFNVDDFNVAKSLHNTSYKITQRNYQKFVIQVRIYLPTRNLISFTPVSSEVREKMIEAIVTRYNSSTKSLDLSQFHASSLFTNNQLFVPLNQPAVLLAALNMAAQHTKHDLYGLSLENNHIYLNEGLVWIRRLFPELKMLDLAGNKFSDLKEIRCLSGYTIHELNLSRNPVCNTEDKERFKWDVQELFPILKLLDNSELPPRNSTIIGSKYKMLINLGNSYPIPEGHNHELPIPIMAFIESFLNQYYVLYDNQESRQLVSEAYLENSIFTLSSYFQFTKVKSTSKKYLHESRNFLKSDHNRHGCLHIGKEDIKNFLNKLPKTKHDIGSFIVDVPLVTAAMIQIVVNGVFAEDYKEKNGRPVYRSFCRTFCLVPIESGWCIISDMLFVTTVTDEILLESSKRFHEFKPKPVSSKKNNLNGNSYQNGRMFMEISSSYQQPDKKLGLRFVQMSLE